jgi:hypothetical protein
MAKFRIHAGYVSEKEKRCQVVVYPLARKAVAPIEDESLGDLNALKAGENSFYDQFSQFSPWLLPVS